MYIVCVGMRGYEKSIGTTWYDFESRETVAHVVQVLCSMRSYQVHLAQVTGDTTSGGTAARQHIASATEFRAVHIMAY